MLPKDTENIKCKICDSTFLVHKIGDFYFCSRHYQQIKKGKEITKLQQRDCCQEHLECFHCKRKKRGGYFGEIYYCATHLKHMKKFGKIVRTLYDRNDYNKKDDYYEIILRDGKFNIIDISKIDINDYEEVKKYKWRLSERKGQKHCITTYAHNKWMFLHNFLLNPPSGKEVDHINHDGLDNRRYNLRICTRQENLRNASIRCDNTSGIIGVGFNNDRNKWSAYIGVNNQTINLGRFNTKEQAIKARKAAEIKYFGEFRNMEND